MRYTNYLTNTNNFIQPDIYVLLFPSLIAEFKKGMEISEEQVKIISYSIVEQGISTTYEVIWEKRE